MVLNPIGIETRAFHLGPRTAVVIDADCVVQQKFGLSFGSVDFELDHTSQTTQHSKEAAGPLLRTRRFGASLRD